LPSTCSIELVRGKAMAWWCIICVVAEIGWMRVFELRKHKDCKVHAKKKGGGGVRWC
jgi:hypothetical protein